MILWNHNTFFKISKSSANPIPHFGLMQRSIMQNSILWNLSDRPVVCEKTYHMASNDGIKYFCYLISIWYFYYLRKHNLQMLRYFYDNESNEYQGDSRY